MDSLMLIQGSSVSHWQADRGSHQLDGEEMIQSWCDGSEQSTVDLHYNKNPSKTKIRKPYNWGVYHYTTFLPL